MNPKVLEDLRQANFPFTDPNREPTIDDLITACGDSFGILVRQEPGLKHLDYWWSAWGKVLDADGKFQSNLTFDGDSAIEALSYLWLSIHDPFRFPISH